MSHKVSIIMPIHNRSEYVKEALKSVFQQTMTDFEIICVDDGSDEVEVIELLQGYAGEHSNMQLITLPESRGAGNARNVGFEKADGEYVMFLDSDDIFLPHMLEKLHGVAINENADITFTCFNEFEEVDGEKVIDPVMYGTSKIRTLARDRELFIQDMIKEPWSKLYRTDFLREKNIKFQRLSSCNDVAFTVLANLSTERYAFAVDEPLILYRLGNNRISAKRNPMNAYAVAEFLKKELNARNLLTKQVEHQFRVFLFAFFLLEMQMTSDDVGRQKLYEKMNEYFTENPVDFVEEETINYIRQIMGN